ncbi:hypothetical protein PPYR_15268 [Photinus pyralis]|uniref:DUF4218 domain-containing protein n=1 Tax=Photinus pyralis TaxID=7054 RepID=A0A5N3ZZ71_PHOPY|nr:hypothetical protein PPYR_15268 [Photinus pyralis]
MKRSRKDFTYLSNRQKRRVVLQNAAILETTNGSDHASKESTVTAEEISVCNSTETNEPDCEWNTITFLKRARQNNIEEGSEEGYSYNQPSDLSMNDRESGGGWSEDIHRDNFHDCLREIIVKHNVSHSFVNDLLHLLKMNGHPELPKDVRTLMCTPKNTSASIITLSGGRYVHLGLANGICNNIKQHFTTLPNEIKLNINIDGLPISKSSTSQFWPILAAIYSEYYTEPFVIGVFHGMKKPDDSNVFLKPFVDELKSIFQSGSIIIKGKIIPIKINAIICDAPAKAFISGIKNHSGYFACSKCIIEGDFVENRVIFNETNCRLRTDLSFTNREQPSEHHRYSSILEDLNIGMVSQIVLDCMHLVYLGVTKRLIQFWVNGRIHIRLKPQLLKQASDMLLSIKSSIPIEFVRKPRSLYEVDRWKATEYRQFLLYTGPVILRNILHKKMYRHFLCLSVALRIISDKEYCQKLVDYAESLLVYFVQKYAYFYGEEHLSYNVHNLIHICDEVRHYGSVEGFSAFKLNLLCTN